MNLLSALVECERCFAGTITKWAMALPSAMFFLSGPLRLQVRSVHQSLDRRSTCMHIKSSVPIGVWASSVAVWCICRPELPTAPAAHRWYDFSNTPFVNTVMSEASK